MGLVLIGVLGFIGAGCTGPESAPANLQTLWAAGSSGGAGGTSEQALLSDGGAGGGAGSGGSGDSGSAGGEVGSLSGSGGLTGSALDASASEDSVDSPGVGGTGGSADAAGDVGDVGDDGDSGGAGEAAFGGVPAAIPGTVQMENYDTGGAGVGYQIKSMNGTANSYRPDGVNLENAIDVGDGLAVGWTSAGIWFRYTVDVAASGNYVVSFRVAADSAIGAQAGMLHLQTLSGMNLTGAVIVPGTGGWQAWTTVSAKVTLSAGQQVLELFEETGGYNMNYMTFAPE